MAESERADLIGARDPGELQKPSPSMTVVHSPEDIPDRNIFAA
jgi:hypothetical protein